MRIKYPLGLPLACSLLALQGCFVTTDDPVATPSRATAVMGTNLSVIADWSSEVATGDVFKNARAWFSGSDAQWQDEAPLDLDDQGWVRSLDPGQVARTIMLSDGVRYPPGDYVVSHEGTGTLEYRYSGHTDVVKADGPGEDVLVLDTDVGGISITILDTEQGDYLRNFRVSIPGGACEANPNKSCASNADCGQSVCNKFAGENPPQFNPDFVESVRSYGVLRFMDWMQTNGSKQQAWNDRPVPNDSSYTKRGVPVEVMVALANQTEKDPWFCMPHLADDTYVERFATYVRDNLAPGRKAYVEYSNEVWNDLFEQALYARNQGKSLGIGSSDFEAQLGFYARRSTEVHKIWEQVFGGSARLVRVTASQGSNAWVSNAILGYKDTAAHTDVLAIAPYFGSEMGEPDAVARVQNMSVDQLITELRDQHVPQAVRAVGEHARVAAARNVELVAYEGGQHLVGTGSNVENDDLNNLFDAANRDPRMKDVYARYLKGWRQFGGRLFVHFTSCGVPTKYGRWGAREWMAQPRAAAPKYDAIMEYIDANPRWW